jgi:hypothetical protein
MFTANRFLLTALLILLCLPCSAQTRRRHKTAKPAPPQSEIRIVNAEPLPIIVRRSTPLKLVMPYPVSISASPIGHIVNWHVAEDFVQNGAILIPKGALATARVTTIFNTGNRPRLSMALSTLHLPTGETAPLSAEISGNRFINFETTKTNDAVVPEGKEIDVFLAGDLVVRPTHTAQMGTAIVGAELAPANPVVLHGATPVKLKLARTLTSEYAEDGDRVAFRVVEPVCVNDLVVVTKGAIAWATITRAKTAKNYGRSGKLILQLDYVQLLNGDRAYLTATTSASPTGEVLRFANTWGLMPLSLTGGFILAATIEGKDTMIPEGQEIIAYIKDDVTLDASKLQAH